VIFHATPNGQNKIDIKLKEEEEGILLGRDVLALVVVVVVVVVVFLLLIVPVVLSATSCSNCSLCSCILLVSYLDSMALFYTNIRYM
jgi:hypothetical protein